jgi:hypothetical protein
MFLIANGNLIASFQLKKCKGKLTGKVIFLFFHLWLS